VIEADGGAVSGYTRNANGVTIDTFTLPSPACQPDAGVYDVGPDDAGVPGAVAPGDGTPPLHSCGSAGAATLLCLLPLLLAWRRRASC